MKAKFIILVSELVTFDARSWIYGRRHVIGCGGDRGPGDGLLIKPSRGWGEKSCRKSDVAKTVLAGTTVTHTWEMGVTDC